MMRKFLCITLLAIIILQVNCQSNDEDEGGTRGSFEGDEDDSASPVSKKNLDQDQGDKPAKQDGSPDKPKDETRPRTQYAEERFSQLFVPRNSRRKLVSPRYTARPKPTLPSFIKKPPSVKPPEPEIFAPRVSPTPQSRTTTSRTTTRPSRSRGRASTPLNSRFNDATSSTTEPSRRGFYSTARSSNRFYSNRGRF